MQADLLIANRSDTWTYQVLHALQDFPTSQQFLNAIRSRKAINIKQFELTLRERIIGSWRELDNLKPHDNHYSSRIMRTYHTHFGEPLWIALGWWDDKKRMRHDRNRRPYELRICDRCDWHTIQDEEHILLDCPHEHLVRLRTQQQLIFSPQFEDEPARLRTFMNQPDIFGVASFVAKCLALFP